MQTKALKINIFERRALICLTSVALMLAGLYIYFVSAAIINTIVRGEIERDVSAISSDVGELESEYIARKNLIDVEFVYSLGFVDVYEKSFVSRAPFDGKGLSLNQ